MPEKPLDEIVWHGCFEKTFCQGRQRAGAPIKAVKWACMGVLVATAVVSDRLTRLDLLGVLVATAGAVLVPVVYHGVRRMMVQRS